MVLRQSIFKTVKFLKPLLFSVVAVGLLSACSGTDRLKYQESSVTELYDNALGYLNKGQFKFSAVAFDEVERQHPYSSWARRSQLMSAYSYYKANKLDEAILAAERFVSLHPGNKDAAYAYYLIGICHYMQIADIRRDQKETELAMAALSEVVRRYPFSKYAADAKLKIDLTRDHLAGKEMRIGRFYQKNDEYFAAIGRFTNVIRKYQTTSHVPEALHRLTEVYMALGILPEAYKTAAVLGENYPDSEWYKFSYDLMQKYNVQKP
ncbi:competence lipoprotein ComL, putative [hydrothermal vent metagenome]|uniref:Competence lipoprotein ComL, putative n=1 Tax=hydrothermal vent metagenome TaxID=652676 RepID=A0A3B0SV30_9ZZZZ